MQNGQAFKKFDDDNSGTLEIDEVRQWEGKGGAGAHRTFSCCRRCRF